MKVPTIEEIRSDGKVYQQHLDRGGEPIRIILELLPWNYGENNIGMEWKMKVNIPDNLKLLEWITMFTEFIKDRVNKAIQP